MSIKKVPAKIAPLTRATLRGVWCALIVPWTDRDELDARRLVKEVRGYGGTGVNGVYTGGTTGEFYAQDDATYEKITLTVCEEAHALGLPVQIGASALSTRTACRRIQVALRAKADAIQILLPFWLVAKCNLGDSCSLSLRRCVRLIPIALLVGLVLVGRIFLRHWGGWLKFTAEGARSLGCPNKFIRASPTGWLSW